MTELDREIVRSSAVMDQNWEQAREQFERFTAADIVVLAASLDPDRNLRDVTRKQMGLVAYLAGLSLKQIMLDMAIADRGLFRDEGGS